PIGSREQTAGVRIIDPRIEILIPDSRQIGIGPQEFIGDARAFADHLPVFHCPALENCEPWRFGSMATSASAAMWVIQSGCSALSGFRLSRNSVGRLEKKCAASSRKSTRSAVRYAIRNSQAA